MSLNMKGRTALVTGGTKGIGRAVALEFARHGAQVWLTHRWGSVPDEEVREYFLEHGALTEPVIFQANVSDAEDTRRLLQAMSQKCDIVDYYISNAASIHRIRGIEDYKLRTFLSSMERAAWPLAAYPLEMKEIFGNYPRYVIGLSTYAAEKFHPFYDYSAMAKSALETMAKYLAIHLQPHGTRVNVLRLPWIDTESPEAVFGKNAVKLARALIPDEHRCTTEDVAKTVLGLCSGYMDAMTGQVLGIDRGGHFQDHALGMIEFEHFRKLLKIDFEAT